MTPINKILPAKQQIVRWKDLPAANQELQDQRTLMKEAAHKPTTSKELFMGYPQISRLGRCIWRGCWKRLATRKIYTGTDDFVLGIAKEIAGQTNHTDKPKGGLGYKQSGNGRTDYGIDIVGRNHWHQNLCYKHVGIFRDNTAEVLWTQRGASKKSAAEGRLFRVSDLRQRVTRASPLVAAHVAVDLNVIGDIPSRSFDYSKQWNCTNNHEFLSLINSKFPFPHKRFWKGFRPSSTLTTKVISKLGTKASLMVKWNRLRSGVPVSNPS